MEEFEKEIVRRHVANRVAIEKMMAGNLPFGDPRKMKKNSIPPEKIKKWKEYYSPSHEVNESRKNEL